MPSLGRQSTIGFIGAGTVGGSLAICLWRHGYPVVATASRTFSSAQALADRVEGCVAYQTGQGVVDNADVIFITTPDDAIGPVCTAMSWRPGQGVVHCSGAASLDVLAGATVHGAIAGGFHPLQAFSSVENGVKSVPGATIGIEGEDEMREFLKEMALDIGGNPIPLRAEDKALYHLSGMMMGNLLTEYVAITAQLWEQLGMSRAEGIKALVPMMRQVSNNLDTSGVPGAIAGPYVRGDIGTIRKHLETLRIRAPSVLPLYCELALAGLPFAVEKGTLKPGRADEIKALVEDFRRKTL